jgi:hypothetical protein
VVSRRPSSRVAKEEVRQFKDRLRFALELSGLGQNEVARKVRASQSVASKWFDPETDTLPGGRFVGRLARILGINGHWLVTGEGHWHNAPVSGRKDVTHAQGVEVGMRTVMAHVRRALDEAEVDLDRIKRDATQRERAAVEDAEADLVAGREDPRRQGSR